MALGRPSITTPSALNLQAIQQAIANISERFRQTDQVIQALGATTTTAQASGVSTYSELRAQISALALRVAALESGRSGSGAQVILTARSALRAGDPVRYYLGDQCALMDPDDLSMATAFIGVSAYDVQIGQQATITIVGEVEVAGAAFVVSEPLYASPGGGLTHNPAGNALLVGVATSSRKVGVGGADGVLALREPTVVAGGVERELKLPAAYSLVLRSIAERRSSPIVTGAIPPEFVYTPDGSVVY